MSVSQAVNQTRTKPSNGSFLDPLLLVVYLCLVGIGIIAIYSATIAMAYEQSDAFLYLRKLVMHTTLAVAALLTMSIIPISFLKRSAVTAFLISVVLLIAVLIPTIGIEINGSHRWIRLGGLLFQPSEIAELGLIISIAWFLTKQKIDINDWKIAVAPIVVMLGTVAFLLLLEPDYGSVIVVGTTVFTMMFLNGIRGRHLFVLSVVGLIGLIGLILVEPYRMLRLTTFLNPWADPWGSGFQLSQSLIAFGRGELLGTGLGTSVQKLFYLPYAGSDFLFAIIGEEFGFVGTATVIVLFAILVGRILHVATVAQETGDQFASAMAQGIAVLIAIGAIINMGVNMGVLPTKGLTLPFMSIGGTSLIVYSAAIGIVLSIQREARRRGQN